MFSAGVALDPIARSEDPVGILWRERLALAAAAVVSRLEGRREGKAQLRNAFALYKPGDDPGPAGRMLIGWRALGEARALRSADWPARPPGFFDLPPEPASEILRDLGARFIGRTPPLRFAAEAAREILASARPGVDWHSGWPMRLWPGRLAGSHRRRCGQDICRARPSRWRARPGLRPAQAPGAVAVFDLHVDLTRSATALRAANLRRPGKDTGAIITSLLTENALAARCPSWDRP